MIKTPMDVLHVFPVRKTKKQKQMFRDAVIAYAKSLDYPAAVEAGNFGSRNVVIGDPETARYLVTAHYDTCACLLVPNYITPCNPFVFYLTKFAVWFCLILLGSIMGAVGGLLMGESWVSLFAALSVLGMVALMLLGPANKNNANDNTSGVVTLLEIARSLPENQRSKVCFVLFDLEEAGLIGSASYRKAHIKETDHQLIVNLDCVGDGDHILLFPTKKLKKDTKKLEPLYKCCGYFGAKSVLVRDKGTSIYPSDQKNFPYGVGVAAFHKGKAGLYLSRIHTSKDTILEETNVNILRAAIVSMVTAAQ